jgi:hypothetical protein
LIFSPAIVLGISAIVFFSGIPSDAAGPVADTVTPTLMSARASVLESSAAARATGLRNFICGLLV